MNKLLITFSLLVATSFFGSQPLKAQPHHFENAKLTEFAMLLAYCDTPQGTFPMAPGYYYPGTPCFVAPWGPYGPILSGTVVLY